MVTVPLPRDVHQAVRLLEDSPEAEHTPIALARACGVSPRTLQKHFRQFLGRPPTEVLRDIRLDLVRRELLLGRNDTSVSELATRRGFNHLGRFSGWYRGRYGESPSATLRRSRRPIVLQSNPGPAIFVGLQRPTVAVLPFDLVGPCGSMVTVVPDEIAVALSRRGGVSVSSRYGAQYHVRGKIHACEDNQIKVVVTLWDVVSDRLVWADSLICDGEKTAGVEQRIAERITIKLVATIQDTEIKRANRAEVRDLSSWGLTMRALSLALVQEPSSLLEGVELAAKAAELDPTDPLTLALLAWSQSTLATFPSRGARDRVAARAYAKRTEQLSARDPLAEGLLAASYSLLHDVDTAELHIDRALSLDGGCALVWMRSGYIKVYRGRPQEAIECLQIAHGLDPYGRLRASNASGVAYANFEAGRYRDAARWWRRGLTESPREWWPNKFLGSTLALLGRKDEAREVLSALEQVSPGWTFNRTTPMTPNTDQFMDQLANGWESVGVRPI
jgi:AraC-like DNA-binding protein/tetratricopeptide (TPR) repeat protein